MPVVSTISPLITPLVSIIPELATPSPHPNPQQITLNLRNKEENRPVSRRLALNLRTNPANRTGGLFKHFAVTSRDEHLTAIHQSNERWREDAEAYRLNLTLREIEQKAKKTKAARLRKQEQRARDKIKAGSHTFFFGILF